MRLTGVDLALLILASYRLTHLVVFDRITAPVRNALKRWLGPLVSCFWCGGVWISAGLVAGFAYWPVLFWPLVLIFAVAGGQSFLESILWYLGHSPHSGARVESKIPFPRKRGPRT